MCHFYQILILEVEENMKMYYFKDINFLYDISKMTHRMRSRSF